MSDDLRLTIDEIERRMKAGEDFLMIDTRNPEAWKQSNQKAPGAIRVAVDDFENHLPDMPKSRSILTYCT